MDVREQYVTVTGLRIHYLSAGDSGSPLLLLHGTGIDSARLSWGRIIGPLAAAGYRAFAPDCPGYGDSDCPDLPYSIDYYVGFVGEFMNALGLASACVMGISMGGGIALGMALRWPERVDRLVLVDSYGLQRTVAMQKISYIVTHIPGLMKASYALARNRSMARATLGSILYDASKAPESLLDEIMAEGRKPHAGRAAAALQRHDVGWHGVRTVYLDRLGEIRVPTLLVHGREDRLVPLHWAEEAHRRIPGSRLHVIEEAGHWPHPEKPQELIQATVDFLRSTEPAAGGA